MCDFEVVEVPRGKLRETIWERPHAFLKPLCNPDAFLDAVRSNHLHLVYGSWESGLEEVCGILDIKPVMLSEVGTWK